MSRNRCDHTPAWSALRALYDIQGRDFDLRQAFAADAQRFGRFSLQAPHVFADLSKNLINAAVQAQLLELAHQCGVKAHREAMFRGDVINKTEQRRVMHFLLRYPAAGLADTAQGAANSIAKELGQVHSTLNVMLTYAEMVRHDKGITDIVNIGIGGSDLGPQMAVLALDEFVAQDKRFHFVSSVDGHELSQVLRQVQPESTLFLIASKSFTTLETMTNARSAKAWFEAKGGRDIARHFCALTSNVEAAREFGIGTTFDFWDWVGGRYSMWSAIGLPIAIAIGPQRFREMLAGAHAMDEHFRLAPLEQNLPVLLALLDIWYRNFHGFGSRSVAPYHSGLRRMQAYLQQLEMESNGKRVDEEGQALPYATSPVIWGEPAANGQHAYFQMLHQGSDVIPVEFIAVKKVAHPLPEHHHKLLANALAQSRALMLGQPDAGGHRHLPGNRPSTFLLLDELTPASLGAIIALQEHRVFVTGSLWGINSFDQWGVELGKVLAKDMEQRLDNGNADGLDASSAGLLKKLRTK
ncbi:MAG: glucose-6-phosphate isomerase [Curvibacter sp. GWA2_64_110]|nr:MAG: glucose-6-phosphate isomerase [Curvibacter sp. GWA2_64_110]HCY15694.1 glucose-6-phosphate isomerase [Curvibacter sp.]